MTKTFFFYFKIEMGGGWAWLLLHLRNLLKIYDISHL